MLPSGILFVHHSANSQRNTLRREQKKKQQRSKQRLTENRVNRSDSTSSSLQCDVSVKSCTTDTKRPANLGNAGLAICIQGLRYYNLLLVQSLWTTTQASSCTSDPQASSSPFLDEGFFKFRYSSKDMEDEHSAWCGGVQVLSQNLQTNPTHLQRIDRSLSSALHCFWSICGRKFRRERCFR